MQPIAHFFLSILAGYGVGLHLDNRIKKLVLITLLALLTCAIDLDHLLPQYQESQTEIFHNFFVFITLPAVLFLLFFTLEHKKKTTLGQRSCLVLSVMFIGAMLTDGMSGSKMALFYPLHSQSYVFINLGVDMNPAIFSLSSQQVFLIIWGILILFANFIESLTYKENEGKTQEPFQIPRPGLRTYIKNRIPRVVQGMAVIVSGAKGTKESENC